MRFPNSFTFCVLTLVSVAALTAQTQVTFREGYNGGNGSASAIVVADFNNDGFPDVAAADIYNGLTIFLGNGNGTFKELPTLAVFGTSIATADFNGDGIADLVVGGYTLLGNGDGTFQSPVEYSSTAYLVAIADFNGDGIPDLAAVSGNDTVTLQVFFGDGTGVFAAGPVTTLGAFYTAGAIVAADFGNDGVPDLAIALTTNVSEGDGYVDVLTSVETQPPGNFSIAQIQVGGFTSYPSALVAADFNGDGYLDIAVGDRNLDQITILLGSKSDGFEPLVPFSSPQITDSLVAADLNGDGVPDLIAGGSTGEAAVYFGKGNGSFTFQHEWVTGYESSQIALADLTADGTSYLISGNFTDIPNLKAAQLPGLTVMPSTGPGIFVTAAAYPAGPAPGAMAVGDFTGSGNPDVAVIGHSPFVQVFLGDGKGHLQPAQQYPLSSDAKGIAAADVTGDGTLDLVTAGRNAVLTLPGNGDGGFGTAISSPCPDCNGLIVVADVNHDGKLDVITTNNEGVVVLFGNGDGTFQTGTVYPISRPSSLAAGDLNGDGNLDLVVTSDSEMHGVFIFYGAANGTFGTPVPLNNGGSGAIVADFNNDGYLDIAMSFDGRLAVYLGNGNGTFSAPLLEKARVFPPLLAGDFNGDGTLDIVGIHSALPGNTAILLGNGDGTFTGQNQTYLLDSGYADAFQFAAGYFNAGGQLDLVSTNGGGNAVWLLVNTTP